MNKTLAAIGLGFFLTACDFTHESSLSKYIHQVKARPMPNPAEMVFRRALLPFRYSEKALAERSFFEQSLKNRQATVQGLIKVEKKIWALKKSKKGIFFSIRLN